MTSAESFDTEAIGVKNGGQEASKVPLYAVIGLAVLCAVLLIAVIALSIVLMGKEDVEGTDQPENSARTGSKHRAGDVEYPDIPEEDNSNVPSASAPASSPLSRPPPASQNPSGSVPGSRPSPSSVAQPSSSNNPAPQPGPPVVTNVPTVAVTSLPNAVDSSSANPNPPSPDSSATSAPDSSSESSTMNAPQGSNGNSSSAHGKLSPGPVNDKLYDSNRTAKLSAINTEEGSVKLSDYVLSVMNQSADPCNDFFNFACGRFGESQLVKKGDNLENAYNDKRRALLFEKLRNTNHSTFKAAEMARKYGKKCKKSILNIFDAEFNKTRDEWTLRMIEDFLAVSDIPFITGSDGSNFSFSGSLETALSYNATVLLTLDKTSFAAYINGTTVSTLVPHMLMAFVLVDSVYNESSEAFSDLKSVMMEKIQKLAELKNVKLDDATIDQTAADLIKFAYEFKQMSEKFTYGEILLPLHNTSWAALELDKLAKKYNWSDNVQMYSYYSFDGFAMLSDLIRKTNKTTLGNYFAVSTYHQADLFFRKIDCDFDVLNLFLGVISHLNEELFPVENYRPRIEKMLNGISDSMREIFHNADWLTNQTRMKAIEKLNAATNCIGYHDIFFNATEVDAYYAHLSIEDGDSFPLTAIKVQKANLRKRLQNIGGFMDRTDFCLEIDLTVYNAFHHRYQNMLVITGGIMQFPMIEEGIPESVLYGSLGIAVGHEFTHGFDNTGKAHGPFGQKMNWWTPEDDKKFMERSDCLVNFFNNYTDPLSKRKENGTLTLGENIADLGGIKAALKAYRNFVKSAGKVPPPMPGFEDFTDEQAMFVASTTFFCRSLNSTRRAELIETDVHALSRARVNNLATNTKEFADIFNCPLGSNHNPTQPRCEIW